MPLSSSEKRALCERRIREGKCPSHPRERARPGGVKCRRCVVYASARYRARVENKLCNGCPRPVEKGKRHCSACLLAARHRMRRIAYGITPEEFAAMFRAQGGRCKLCRASDPKSKKGWVVDHCHKTKAVRGVLCQRCNLLLGYAEDSIRRLREAIRYLNSPNPRRRT
jgi:hypothetical protein